MHNHIIATVYKDGKVAVVRHTSEKKTSEPKTDAHINECQALAAQDKSKEVLHYVVIFERDVHVLIAD